MALQYCKTDSQLKCSHSLWGLNSHLMTFKLNYIAIINYMWDNYGMFCQSSLFPKA